MAQIPNIIEQSLRRYISELKKNNFPIQQAYLFGSYAKGTYTEWSDIDVALVSPKFAGDRFDDKKNIARITLDVNYNISPLPYRPEEFTTEDLFVKEIIQTGIRIV